MARYALLLLVIASLFITGCMARPYHLLLSIYNDCSEPIELYKPSDALHGKKIENANFDTELIIIARQHYLSDSERNKRVEELLRDTSYSIMAELPDGEKIYFTPEDMLMKGERPHPDVLHYYICKNRKTTGGK